MTTILGILMLIVALVVGWVAITQSRRGQTDLFCVRNFFLLGFVVFQLTSATITFWTGYYDALVCTDYATTGLFYTIVCLTWLSLFMLFYKHNAPAKWLATKLRSRHGESGPMSMLVLALSFLVAAIFCRLVLTQIPVVGVLALVVTTGLAGAAAGMASWAWAPRPFNPLVAVFAGAIIFGALGIVLYQAFGRRDALSVVIACVWGAHHGYWKHIGIRAAMKQLVPLGLAGLVFMGGLSAGRSEKDYHLGFVESITRVGSGNVGEGILAMASGQAAAACSMWIVETRPHSFPYDTLHTFRYFIGHPVPRIIWPEKPMALGWEMTAQGNVRGRSKGFNFGPGLVGHIWNDNPWISLIPYAFGLAFLLRFMDRLVDLSPTNPFIIVPLGCALGDIVGLPRGETGLFLSRAVLMMVAAFLGMAFCAGLLSLLGFRAAAAPADAGDVAPPDWDGQLAHDVLVDPGIAAEYTDDLAEGAPRVG